MRIFVAPEQLRAGELAIAGDEHHYVSRVRRARVGDAVELIDGAGRRATAAIVRITALETIVAAGEPTPVPRAVPHVRSLIPWIKGDRMDACVEKLVEVGCDEMIVWPADRAIVQLAGERRDARIDKLRAAAAAAARQCGRAALPEVSAADSLAAMLAELPAHGLRYLLDPASEWRLAGVGAVDDLTFASGPEGGLAPRELAAMVAAGFAPVGLGPRVLRADTAPVVAVAIARAVTDS